jgi:hypothetical protein
MNRTTAANIITNTVRSSISLEGVKSIPKVVNRVIRLRIAIIPNVENSIRLILVFVYSKKEKSPV